MFQLSADGLLTTVAGTGTPGYLGDGGTAAAAQLAFPAGLAMGFDGSLYIADSANHAVRRISSGVITTFASAGTPVGLALDVLATLYVADAEAGAVLRFPLSGALPPLKIPASDVVRAPDLSMYLAESAAGIVQRIPLFGSMGAGGRRGGPCARRWRGCHRRAAESSQRSGRGRVRQPVYRRSRQSSRAARCARRDDHYDSARVAQVAWSAPSGVSVDAAGNIYVVDTGVKQVVRITPAGTCSWSRRIC